MLDMDKKFLKHKNIRIVIILKIVWIIPYLQEWSFNYFISFTNIVRTYTYMYEDYTNEEGGQLLYKYG